MLTKITDAAVFVGGPGKNYVTLKIYTDEGVYGIGDATLNNRETLPAAYLKEYLIPYLIGMDPRNAEDIWQYFYRGAYFRKGLIAMVAIGAIDMALWDIKGKIAGHRFINFLAEKVETAQWPTLMQQALTCQSLSIPLPAIRVFGSLLMRSPNAILSATFRFGGAHSFEKPSLHPDLSGPLC